MDMSSWCHLDYNFINSQNKKFRKPLELLHDENKRLLGHSLGIIAMHRYLISSLNYMHIIMLTLFLKLKSASAHNNKSAA